MAKDTVRTVIRDAFKNIPFPGDDMIVSHKCWECAEVSSKLKGTHWEDWIDQPAELSMRGGGIFLLAPQSFRYFLPAFLISSLKDSNNFISDAVLTALINPKFDKNSPRSSHAEQNWFQERFTGFTAKQIDAIKLYLTSLPPETDLQGEVGLALKSVEEIKAMNQSQ